MINTPEQLDELINRLKNNSDVSNYLKDPESSGSVNLVSLLTNIPKAQIPQPNLLRVRNKILDRISVPAQLSSEGFASGFKAYLPRFIRITSGIVGAFTIVLGLTLGTAVAALESIPGQAIYPIKKMVEKVQLQLADTEEQRTNLQIKFANIRLDELETVLQKQKEGKISPEEVQIVVANTVKDIETTSQTVAEQSKDEPNVNLLTKIVTLTDKQAAVINANLESESAITVDLQKALESSKTTKELAIENIERAGMVVEADPLLIITEAPKNDNIVTAEGKITSIPNGMISIGTVQFLLTEETKYDNIKPEELAVDLIVKITGEIRSDRTYATEIELVSKPEVKGEDTENSSEQTPESQVNTSSESPLPVTPKE